MSCVFISRFISVIRVVCGDMSKLTVWILPQKGGMCTTALKCFPCGLVVCFSGKLCSKAQVRTQQGQMPCSVFL